MGKAQHAEQIDGPQFIKLKLKKPTQRPVTEQKSIAIPKFQLKSRIKHVNDWPPQELQPIISFLGSVKQNGLLSRNMKEAIKIKKRPIKIDLPDFEKTELEKPESFDFTREPSSVFEENKSPHQPQELSEETPESPKIRESKLSEDDIPEVTMPAKEPKITKPVEITETKVISADSEMVSSDVAKLEEVPMKTSPEEPDSISFVPETSTEILEESSLQSNIIESQENQISNDKIQSTELVEEGAKRLKPKKPKKKVTDISENDTKPSKILTDTDTIEPQEIKPIAKKTQPTTKAPLEQESEVKDVIEDIRNGDDLPLEIINDLNTSPELEEQITTVKKVKKTKKKAKEENIPEKPQIENNEVKDKLDSDMKFEAMVESSKPVKCKLTPIKIERKVLEVSKAQHAESSEAPQFTKLKLKKTVTKPKDDSAQVTLPKFMLKSRIKFVKDWPPSEKEPIVSFLGSVRQNGILSRNVKEAAKIKKKLYKEPQLPEIEKTELEKPMFGHEDIVDAVKLIATEGALTTPTETEDKPEQFTIKPRRPSVKVAEEITDEVTLKKKLKPVRKSSITLPEVTEPENVTFRPKSTKTKEDVEQEFNIQLDSYAEEEISMSSKVKLKPQRQPTFNEEADETSIKFYEEEEGPDNIEIIESDLEGEEETANILMALKKTNKKPKQQKEITSSVTIFKPKTIEEPSEITEDVSLKLQTKPKYTVDDQEEVSFDVKPKVEQFTSEELSLSSKIKLKSKKKMVLSEAADETSIQLMQEIEDDSQVEEVVLSDAESDDNVEMVIKRKPKKPAYEVSEIEELSVELKPKRINDDAYEEERLTILAKRKPKKPSIQGIRSVRFYHDINGFAAQIISAKDSLKSFYCNKIRYIAS